MAHMIDGKGPYPDKAGEYCGNYYCGLPIPYKTPEQPATEQGEHLARMRFGRPRPCKAKYQTTENGWVGLYLKEDRPLPFFETPCATPPELLEPPLGD